MLGIIALDSYKVVYSDILILVFAYCLYPCQYAWNCNVMELCVHVVIQRGRTIP